jgi:hypothetical protein
MNAQERIAFYLQESIKRCTDTQARRVSAVLVKVLPDIVKSLHALIIDGTVTASERLEAVRILNGFIKRCERSKRPERKRAVKPPELTAEEFADKLLHASPETLEKHFKQMLVVAENWKRKYNGE